MRDPVSVGAAALVTLIGIAALGAPWVAPYDPLAVNLDRLLEGSNRHHWLGTDGLGRDVLSRLIHGARWSLGTALLVTACVTVVGTLVGAVAGYYRGAIDTVVSRVIDALLAFPTLLLALAIVAVLGPGFRGVIIALVSVGWATTARIVRAQVLSLRDRDFVLASRSVGAPSPAVLARHVIPNVASPVIVLATVEIGQLILALAGLSFLGLGVQSPTPEWGTMIDEGRRFLFVKPDLMIYPGLAISTVVIGFNTLGDRLRDVLDPRLAEDDRATALRSRLPDQ